MKNFFITSLVVTALLGLKDIQAQDNTEQDRSAEYAIIGDDPREHVIYFFGDLFEKPIENITKEISRIINSRRSADSTIIKNYTGEPRIFLIIGNDGGMSYESVSILSDFMRINAAEFVAVVTGRIDYTAWELMDGADVVIALPYSSITFRYSNNSKYTIDYTGFTAGNYEEKLQEIIRAFSGAERVIETLKQKIVSNSDIKPEEFDKFIAEQRPISARKALDYRLVDYVMTPTISVDQDVTYIFDN